MNEVKWNHRMKISVNAYRLTAHSFHHRIICCSKFTTSNRSYTKNYYTVLHVDPKASKEEIKNAYLELSKKYHPDKNRQDPRSHDRYVEIQEAYRILVNDGSRKTYDDSQKYKRVKSSSKDYERDVDLKFHRDFGFSSKVQSSTQKTKRQDNFQYEWDVNEPQSWAVSQAMIPVLAGMLFIISSISMIDTLLDDASRKKLSDLLSNAFSK